MGITALDVRTDADGSVVVRPHGLIGPDHAVELRQVLVHTVRKIRPLRLVLDLADVSGLDPINIGTVSAVCDIADEHSVAVFVDCRSAVIAGQLTAAGVSPQRLRLTPTGI
jgi:anti-anti-sigma regulatory factor